MQVLLMTVPVLLPLAGGFFMLVMGTGREGAGKKQERNRLLFMEAVVLAASFSVWALIDVPNRCSAARNSPARIKGSTSR